PAYCTNPCTEQGTGSPILAKHSVQMILEQLWKESLYDNPAGGTYPQGFRQESYAYLVPDGSGGYSMTRSYTPPSLQDVCQVAIPRITNLPPGTILVHTHPYAIGENQPLCPQEEPTDYTSGPGVEDRATLNALGVTQGIIIDNNNIVFFTGDSTETISPI